MMTFTSRNVLFFGAILVVAVTSLGYLKKPSESGGDWSNIKTVAKPSTRTAPCIEDISVTQSSALPQISMLESSDMLGQKISTKTFGLSVSDINGDRRDDILIGAHELNPYLLINGDMGFTDESKALFQSRKKYDRHGYTLADLDNDGDLDIAIASGGSDGVGEGSSNIFLRNQTKHGVPLFQREVVSPDMAMQAGRSRSFIPIASSNGETIDLYYATRLRKEFPNKTLRNSSGTENLQFHPDEQNFLSQTINDHGRGVIADFDTDGKNDYLVVDGSTLKIYWDPASNREVTTFASNVLTTSAADFNNDGLLDIFIGRLGLPSNSDNLTHSNNSLIFVIKNNAPNDTSLASFTVESSVLEFNLRQHIPASLTKVNRPRGASDIFLGRDMSHPQNKRFSISGQQALGKPDSFDRPGTYIWYSTSSATWNIKWLFHDSLDTFKGIVNGVDIANVSTSNFFDEKSRRLSDSVLINQGGGVFTETCKKLPSHQATTSGTTVADFNNDGWLDIIGVRHGEQGSPNRDLFVLANNQGVSFTSSVIKIREEDRLHRSDLIAHGFFNEDDKPDIVLTNGFGQIPGTNGSPRLMLNSTQTDNQALTIELEGTTSNKYGIGAKLTLTDADNNIVGYRVQGINSNISQDTHRVHFGLGSFRPPYKLSVEWPDNTVTNYSFNSPGTVPVVQ